jgi:hypothetical protein
MLYSTLKFLLTAVHPSGVELVVSEACSLSNWAGSSENAASMLSSMFYIQERVSKSEMSELVVYRRRPLHPLP